MKIKTNIYQITRTNDGTLRLSFLGCNWKCKGCIKFRSSGWDGHLSKEEIEILNNSRYDKQKLKLYLDEVIEILRTTISNKKITLIGYEPTTDENIVEIIKALKNENFYVKLFTNGELLNEEIVDLCDEITLSIKALNPEIHKYYTGVSNEKTLKNFEKFYNSNKIEVESLYIPDLVECDEILKIAEYIAKFNKNLRYRIARYIFSGYGREATYEEVEKCLEKVKKILPNAYTYAYKSGKISYDLQAKCIYPKI